ncbi:MAG: polymerase sigma-70 factor, subfamily [Acidimicrobiaceae bacterium]|jgi:RNA polymerase sigma-70 factor (ECF subfamily)|nr:polymerase sigma-70 factor, subfamily [Acidimicrobiaceae bacterium]
MYGRGGPVDEALELAYRTDRGRVLACLIGIVKDFDLAEDALQDAFAAAATTWPSNGIPVNPAGWLVTTARRKAVDRLRRAAAAERRQRAWGELAIAWDAGEVTGPIADDRLRLIFTCCHPSLSLEARVALTLRSLGGLTTEEVARAFLLAAPALAQRIVRAKRKIRQAGIAYRVPTPDELPERLDAVLTVIYLIFNAGYLAGSGTELVRVDLCDEALRLAGLVVELLPGEPEPLGLAALLHFQDSRRSARVDGAGHPLTLEEQDRGQWDKAKANAGFALLDRAQAMGAAGPHQLKAAIGALHTGAPRASLTDWATIVLLYDRLLEWEPTPIVHLNRAVAVAMADAPAAGLAILDDADLSAELDDYHLFHSTRADLLRRSGRLDEAVIAYRLARDLTDNAVEQSFLARRLDEIATAASDQAPSINR